MAQPTTASDAPRSPYRDRHTTPSDRSDPPPPSSSRAPRPRTVALVAVALGASVLGLRTLWLRPSTTALDAPPGLLDTVRVFPLEALDLGPATPLAPLLAADVPDQLAVLQPAEGAVSVARGEPVSFRFNRPMVASARVGRALSSDEMPLRFTPSVAGTARWTSRSALSFQPDASAWQNAREVAVAFADSLRSLAGESLQDAGDRTLVFDTSVRLASDHDPHRVLPGEPLRLAFDGPVDLALLRSELMSYELGGGRRPLTFGLSSAGRDAEGRSLVDVRLGRTLGPGSRIALVVAPMLGRWGDSTTPESLEFELTPRPRIEGIGCGQDATSADGCVYRGPPGRVVDIDETLRLFSSVPLPEGVVPMVTVNPSLAGMTATAHGNLLSVQGDWEPSQVYEVRLDGLRDAEGHVLARTAPLAVRSAGLPPAVALATALRVAAFERDASTALRFAAVHADHAEVRYQAVAVGHETEALLAANANTLPVEPSSSVQTTALGPLVPQSRANRWSRGVYTWFDPAAQRTSDMAVLQFVADTRAGSSTVPITRLVQWSDTGISARLLQQGVLVWVTSVSDAHALAGAHVHAVDAAGTLLGNATTDAQGLAWLPLRANQPAPSSVAIAVEQGGERAAMLLDARTAVGLGGLGVAMDTARTMPTDVVASVVTDRGAYRPGDTVRAKVVVRTVDGATLHAVTRGRIRVRRSSLGDADTGASATEAQARLGAFGTADVTFVLDRHAAIGEQRLEVLRDGSAGVLGTGTITVADFRQPTFRVDLDAALHDVTAGDPLNEHVAAAYLFGAPASGAVAHWSLVREDVAAMPVRWSHYAFSAVDQAAPSGVVDSGDATLDPRGETQVVSRAVLTVPVRQRLRFEVEVADASGQATATRRDVEVYPATYEIGVHDGPAWVAGGTALDAAAVVIAHDGTPAPGRSVIARIVREGWHSYQEWSGHGESDPSGAYRTRRTHDEQVVATCSQRSADDAVHCPFMPTRPGTYRLEATTTDDQGRVAIASRRVYVAAPTDRPDRDPIGAPIALTPSATTVVVGQDARVTFESPWSSAEALLTVEREGVLYTEHRRVAAGGNTFSFRATPAMVPNAFVSITLARPRASAPSDTQGIDLGAPDLRLGATELLVHPAAAPLYVDLSLPPGPSRPGDEVTVEVRVRDAAQHGTRAELALYAVDEGTLRLTGYQAPDPTDDLFPRRTPAIAIEDLRRQLVSRVEPDPMPRPSGDGGGSTTRPARDDREHFDPTPLWQPHLVTDAQGHARATFRLPARPAEYRVMAVAVDTGMRSGRASAPLVATRPIVVRPAMPRIVTDGDRFEAAAFVHNTTDAALDAQVTFVVDGTPRTARTVHVGAGADVRVGEWIDVHGAQPIALHVGAVADGVADGLDARVPVVPRARPMRSAAVGAVGPHGRSIEVALPADALPEGGEMRVVVASHPFVGLAPALGELTDGDAEATEALASAVLGLVAEARLNPVPGARPVRSVRARGEEILARLAQRQDAQGGFGTWTADDAAQPYTTAWVLHALEAAHRVGWTVPPSMREQALDRVAREVRLTAYFDELGGGDYDALALALRVLADAGRADATRATTLFEQRDRLTVYGQAQLALALAPGDRRRDALVLAAEHRLLPAKPGAMASHATHFYETSTRAAAAVLEAASRIEAGYSDAPRVASLLLGLRSGASWGSAHETAHALCGLAAYATRFRVRPLESPTVTLDGAPLAVAARSRDAVTYALPFDRLVGTAHHTLHLAAGSNAFFALEARWNVALGPADEIARGRRVALHRVLENQAGATLAPGAHVRLGELVRVRLFVYDEAQPASDVVLHDALGGGFDAVDDGLTTTPRESLDALLGGGSDDEETLDPRGFVAQRSIDTLTHRAFGAGEATLMMDRPATGLQEFTFAVRATTVGTFLLAPASLDALNERDYVARSAMQTLVVEP